MLVLAMLVVRFLYFEVAIQTRRGGRGGKSLLVDLTFALIFYTNVLVLWYIDYWVFLLYCFRPCFHLMSLVIGSVA
jgi:hypothetical protein